MGAHMMRRENAMTRSSMLTRGSALMIATMLLAAGAAAHAQGPGNSESDQDIVVLGEKQGRSIKETSTSLTIFDANALLTRPDINSAQDILSRLPNTTQLGKSGIAPSIRGVDGTGPALGANAFLAGTRSRINIQVDGRPITYNEIINGDPQLWDVEQVEVLRGPQSTYQGRNAIGGAMFIKTRDPGANFEAGGRLVIGEQSTRQAAAYISVPLIGEQLGVRVSADYKESDSFVDMAPTPYAAHPEQYRAHTIRAKLVMRPNALEGFTGNLIFTTSKFRGPQVEASKRPFSDGISPYTGTEPVHIPSTTSGIANLAYEVSDTLTLESMNSYTDFKFIRHAANAPARIDGDEIIWEPRARFKSAEGRFKGVIGAYYYRSKQKEQIAIAGLARFVDRTKTLAGYAEGTLELTDQLKVSAGARYEEEKRRRFNTAGLFVVNLDDTYKAFLPKFGISYDITPEATVGVSASRGYNGGGAGFTFNPPFVNFSFGPEFVWNYEAYIRTEIRPSLSFNANVFYSDYEGMQIPFDLNPDPLLNSQIILNAKDVKNYGAEIGLRWRPVPMVEIFGDIGLLHTKVHAKGFVIDGTELARAPDVTGNFGALYRDPNGFEASVDARYSGGYFSDEVNFPGGRVGSYWMANAQVAYNFPIVRIFASLTNIFDTRKPLALNTGNDATLANDLAYLPNPRRLMGGIQVKF